MHGAGDLSRAGPIVGGFRMSLGFQKKPYGFILRGCLLAEDEGWEEPGDLRPLQHHQVSVPAPASADIQPQLPMTCPVTITMWLLAVPQLPPALVHTVMSVFLCSN